MSRSRVFLNLNLGGLVLSDMVFSILRVKQVVLRWDDKSFHRRNSRSDDDDDDEWFEPTWVSELDYELEKLMKGVDFMTHFLNTKYRTGISFLTPIEMYEVFQFVKETRRLNSDLLSVFFPMRRNEHSSV